MSREVLGTRGDAEPEATGGPQPAVGHSGARRGTGDHLPADGPFAAPRGIADRPVVLARGGPDDVDVTDDGAAGSDALGTRRTGPGRAADREPGSAGGAAAAGRGSPPTGSPRTSPALSGSLLSGSLLSGPLLSGRRGLVAAAAAGAVLGGVLAVGVTQRAALQEAQSTASVHAWVEAGTGQASVDAIALTLRVLNTGDAPVTVTGAAMHGGQREDGPVSVVVGDEVTVPPRRMVAVPMEAQADCSGPPLAENGSRDGRLQLRLRTADGREQLVQPPTGGISLTSADVQETFCGQTGVRLGLSVAQTATTPSGGLSMSLLNDAREPVTLDFAAPEGTRVVGEPALPFVVEPSRRTSLSIALEVTSCTADAQRVRAGDGLQLVVDGRARRGGLEPVIVNAWVARQVALACP